MPFHGKVADDGLYIAYIISSSIIFPGYANYLTNMRNAIMNMIVNDKILSLSTNSKESRESKNLSTSGGENGPTAAQKSTEDSLDLSAAGQLLHQSTTTQTDNSRSVPETEEQASTLLAKIRHQFEQSGSKALSAHASIHGNQIDLLLRSAPG